MVTLEEHEGNRGRRKKQREKREGEDRERRGKHDRERTSRIRAKRDGEGGGVLKKREEVAKVA